MPHMYMVAVATLFLIATHQPVAGIHPKHKSLSGSSSFRHSELNQQPEDDEEQPSYFRLRRQNSRYPVQVIGFRQLVPILRSLESKLMRHEYRESQVADSVLNTLNALNDGHRQTKSTLEQMAKQLAAVEERVMATFTLVSTSNEAQRGAMHKLSEGLDRLLLSTAEPSLGRSPNAMPELPPEMVALSIQTNSDTSRDVRAVLHKLAEMDRAQGPAMTDVSSKVDRLLTLAEDQFSFMNVAQREVLGAVKSCSAERDVASSDTSCQDVKDQVVGRMDLVLQTQKSQEMKLQTLLEKTETGMQTQRTRHQNILSLLQQEAAILPESFGSILEGLEGLESASRVNLDNLHSTLKTLIADKGQIIVRRIEEVIAPLKQGQTNIMETLDDTASMTDNLHSTVSDNYDLLSKEISGFNKVEQVMINTADAVLDTKRSIEFGIQQVILELSDIVRKSGSSMNSSLSDQISNISFDILKNQTSALTNMTLRMEGEISQVWRQIGIMYQQVQQSISMLDNLQDTTDLHMNVSLTRVGNMDGTVGEINGKVAGVEDNLNYLLGRLTLVLSEFNHMKIGVGNELEKLRYMAQEVRIPDKENTDNLKYNITNRKRHIVEDYGY